ncbi:hypothetical protein F9278_09545 [Streptomyces phaeolivaceus]|uniref:Uncharacterized protein n=1 Tax=Streptomyces phaeolivaceus TaxID=2653200 RepID=A0A5P8K0B4_9ACTN|nr:hypothetical protein [Streptomyces phaeolivaceus]QFQ96410.1 hypothetical protein F9278_09545 [Streptomyces phaeolivaceus]
MYRALQSYEPTAESHKTYHAKAAAHLDEVVAERRARLPLAQSSLPTLLRLSLDRPFSGELSVSPAPYKEGALARFWG